MPFPTAVNTGVPSGITLTPSGNIIVTKAGTVLDGLDIKGSVVIRADNVTIKNSKITSSSYTGVKVESGYKGASVVNCDIDGLGAYAGSHGIQGSGTFSGNDIRGFENGITLNAGASVVRGNYLHDFAAAGSPHYDGIQVQGGQNGVLIENNTIILNHGQTGAIFLQSYFGNMNDITIRHNYVDGGGYTMYFDGSKNTTYRMTNITWEENYNGKGYWGHEYVKPDAAGNLPTRIGNINVETPLSPDQAPNLGDSTAPDPTPTPEPTPTPTPGDITGTSGNDVLAGTTGPDTMKGLAGNDTYMVNHSGDTIVELTGQGTDRIESTIGYTLTKNVENLKLIGTSAINGTGNELNNFLDGSDGVNVLKGGTGDDLLNGRGGADTLWGNAGRDTFQFTSKWSSDGDKVMDFVRGTDRLDFSGIDANSAASGNQAFSWAGYKSASGTGLDGQIWAVKDATAGETHLYIKTGGSVATVDVAGTGYTLSSADFLL
ncbi:hypothetical protein BB934_27850 (plasmid) [Microvirga ossetica]|uniref:Right handed beta helix domain-containing protein n=1 Tax=Microvirga ossetica TaxID=1882682 RepID=A0A1B2EQB1_9HYPH|nr:right-handed parallel beta-helix repeat-containing protein [Microvirga ossetica]ANY82173.1 hypothetical protein BB934_27850 [Microvirga ossetica]